VKGRLYDHGGGVIVHVDHSHLRGAMMEWRETAEGELGVILWA
jgi:hypothetical protein